VFYTILGIYKINKKLIDKFYNDKILYLGKYTTDYSNLPERYITRKITKIKYKAPEGPE